MLLPEEDDGTYRERIVSEYRRRFPGNPFFVYFILPLLANIISSWLIRWISNRESGIKRLRAEAFDALA